ncbi:MAG: nuclear transport factor 2 family protein, partial [Pseudomonadota bacterium]
MPFQSAKKLVRSFHKMLAKDASGAIATYLSPDCIWRGFHPFGILTRDQIAPDFWVPLQSAIRPMQRREDIFFAGDNSLDAGGVWVVSMGHLMGLFDQPWL